MNTLNHTIKEALKKGALKKIDIPVMYKGYILKNVKTSKGFKVSGYSYKNDILIYFLRCFRVFFLPPDLSSLPGDVVICLIALVS